MSRFYSFFSYASCFICIAKILNLSTSPLEILIKNCANIEISISRFVSYFRKHKLEAIYEVYKSPKTFS